MIIQPATNLEKRLNKGIFTVTGELSSPDSPTDESLLNRARKLSPFCDALNVTDSSSAYPHFSSLAGSAILHRNGIEPVMQINCRDRNRIAIQSDVLGAHALGIRNILCITGDGVESGDHPEAKPVFDLDSVSLLSTISLLEKEGQFLSGRKLESQPKLFLGAAVNPFSPPYDMRPHRLLKKQKAGASFFQSQFCFDIARFKSFMSELLDACNGTPPPILVGVGPLRSADIGLWMRDNIAGVSIPDSVISRMSKSVKKEQSKIGIEICSETVATLKGIHGVAGIHIMAYKWEDAVREIITNTGLQKENRN